MSLALVWSVAPLVAELLSRARSLRLVDGHDDPPVAAGNAEVAGQGVTTLVRVGDEPDEVLADTVGMALAVGPTVIVAETSRRIPEELATLASVQRGATVEDAVHSAAARVRTPATLLVSGRAAPDPGACAEAATALGAQVGWVTGRVRPFNRDGFAPDTREQVGAALRARARRAGLELWEPDATLVRTDLLRRHPLPHGRPWGTWLRERHDEGLRGATSDSVLAYRAAPADPSAFWPDTVTRQRAAAADLSHATTSGPAAVRGIAAALLARELYAVALLGWLAVPVLQGASGEFPFDRAPGWALLATGTLLVLRWASLRGALGLPLHPRRDLASALHHLPGSLAALPATVTRRLRPLRASIPTRPLVWGALVLTVLAGASLIDRDPGAATSKLSVGTSLAALGLLWAFTMRSLVQRSWVRSSARVPLALAASVDGTPVTTVDASPRGVAVRGALDPELRTGRAVGVALTLDDGSELDVPAVVASRRDRHGHALVGLSLEPTGPARSRWLAQVLRAADALRDHEGPGVHADGGAAGISTVAAARGHGPRVRLSQLGDRLAQLCVAAVSVVLVAALVLVLLGFRPLVVRSESMVPTLGVGDVVLAEQVPAGSLRAGDVVTQPERPGLESMTHRVIAVRDRGEVLEVTTRGDANELSETWPVHREELVGRMQASVPWVGRAATGVRTSTGQLALGLVCLAVAVGALLRPVRPTASGDAGHPEPAAG